MTIEELRKNLPELTEQELQYCMFMMNKDEREAENRKKDKSRAKGQVITSKGNIRYDEFDDEGYMGG